MRSPLTFHSYLKPATSSQVPKLYNKVQNLGLFHIDLDVVVNFSSHPPKKSRMNVLLKLFSMIRIHK